MLLISVLATRVELSPYGELEMKRLVATIALAIALLTSGAVVTQHSMVGTAYANGSGD
jgi:hypothetical protein